MNVKDKVVFISGGARGIGAAAAVALAAHGAKVAVNYVSQEAAARDVVRQIEELGGTALAVQADVRDSRQVEAAVEHVVRQLGPVDVLVSNANMAFVMKPILHMTWTELSAKLEDEMKAAFILTKAVVPSMLERGQGRLIYVSSSSADLPNPYLVAHGTAKGALHSFVKYAAQEFGPNGITANAVSPGLVETDASRYTPQSVKEQIAMATPLGRVAVPNDIAGAIVYLASEESRFMTGTITNVNGGILMG